MIDKKIRIARFISVGDQTWKMFYLGNENNKIIKTWKNIRLPSPYLFRASNTVFWTVVFCIVEHVHFIMQLFNFLKTNNEPKMFTFCSGFGSGVFSMVPSLRVLLITFFRSGLFVIFLVSFTKIWMVFNCWEKKFQKIWFSIKFLQTSYDIWTAIVILKTDSPLFKIYIFLSPGTICQEKESNCGKINMQRRKNYRQNEKQMSKKRRKQRNKERTKYRILGTFVSKNYEKNCSSEIIKGLDYSM